LQRKSKNALYFAAFNMASMYFANSYFSGKAVAMLPFEPMDFVSNLSHRNIDDPNKKLVSPFFIIMLTGMAIRGIISKITGLEGPRMPLDLQTPKWLRDMQER
jgi:hypothetical protein